MIKSHRRYIHEMFPQLPIELNRLILAYANMRYHAGIVSNKLDPSDKRLELMQTQLEKYEKCRKYVGYEIQVVIRVTRFKYISLRKIVDPLAAIFYRISSIFTYQDDIYTSDQLYILSTETLTQI
jgi:hypothetical protein